MSTSIYDTVAPAVLPASTDSVSFGAGTIQSPTVADTSNGSTQTLLLNQPFDVGATGYVKGGQTTYNTGTGFFIGNYGGNFVFSLGNPSGSYITWNGTTLTIVGGASISSLNIPDTTTANSMHVDTSGNTWWGANISGGYAAAPASVLATGAAQFSSISITGGTVASGTLNPALQGWTSDIVFTSASATQINWSSGHIVTTSGTTYTITSGNTGTMAAVTYIYFDTNVSVTVLQTTTTYSAATGDGRILIATAENQTTSASVVPLGSSQPIIDGTAQIGALSITAGSIAASTITAAKMNVTQLSAIAADMGTITAGVINLSTSGNIHSGQTAWNTGTGWWMEYNSGTPRFSIGNPAGNYISWDGITLTINGVINPLFAPVAGQDLSGNSAVSVGNGTDAIANGGSGSSTLAFGQAGANTSKVDQVIEFPVGTIINQITLYLKTSGSPADSVKVSVQTNGGSNFPSGTILNSITIAASSLTSSFAAYTLTLGNTTLSANTRYHIVLERTSTLDNTNYYNVEYGSRVSPFIYVATNSYFSGAWNAGAVVAFLGSLLTISGYAYPSSSAANNIFANNFVGFTSTSYSVGNTTQVIIGSILGGFTSLTPGSTYYLNDTAGTIGTSAGTVSRKVGKALSTTQLLIIQSI